MINSMAAMGASTHSWPRRRDPARPGEVAVVFAGRAAMLVTNAAFLRLGWHRST